MKHSFISDKWIAYYPYLLLFIGTIIVLLPSSLAPFANKLTGTDSGVYIYCSEQILKGKIMYKELFDHKGPMLYLINIIGLLIGGGNTTGIWVVELVTLFVSMIFIFKSVRIYFDQFIAFVSTSTCLILFSTFLQHEGGNTTEEYAILFISISIYYFFRFFQRRDLKMYHFVMIAFCASCTFLIKPNFVTPWLTGYITVFILLLKTKEVKKILSISVISLSTLFVVCLPFVLYFIHTNSLLDFKFCFWDFNKAYSDNISIVRIVVHTCKRLWFEPVARTPFQVFLFLYFVGVVIQYKQLKYKTEAWFSICTILLTGVMISISSYVFAHYFLLFVSVFAFPFAVVYHTIQKKFAGNPKWVYCFFVVLLLCAGMNDLRQITAVLPYKKHAEVENLVSFIKENTEELDKITVVGNYCWIYLLSGRESVSKYSYQFPLVYIRQYGRTIAEEYINDIENRKPRMIIVDKSFSENWDIGEYLSILNDILDSQYEKVCFTDIPFDCWLRKQ